VGKTPDLLTPLWEISIFTSVLLDVVAANGYLGQLNDYWHSSDEKNRDIPYPGAFHLQLLCCYFLSIKYSPRFIGAYILRANPSAPRSTVSWVNP
jgi:hypothetical protein